MRRQLPCVPRGRAWLEEEGLHLTFTVELEAQRTLCKVFVRRGDRALLLGTPVPAQNGLSLRRRVSRTALAQAGVYPPEGLEIRTGSEGERWRPVDGDGPRCCDDFLATLLREGSWRWRSEAGGALLCHPWRVGEALPAAALVGFLRLERGRVRLWLDGEGRPALQRPDTQGVEREKH